VTFTESGVPSEIHTSGEASNHIQWDSQRAGYVIPTALGTLSPPRWVRYLRRAGYVISAALGTTLSPVLRAAGRRLADSDHTEHSVFTQQAAMERPLHDAVIPCRDVTSSTS